MRWLMGEESPVKVTAHSTKAILKDDRTIPDTSEIVSVSFDMAEDPELEWSVINIKIRDNFEGSRSYSLEKCIKKLNETGLFDSVTFELLRTNVIAANDQPLEEAMLELKF